MGTTGAFGFRVDGKDKVTFYGHDAYPSGLGASFMKTVSESNLVQLTEVARDIVLVGEEEYGKILNWGDGFFNILNVRLGKPLKMKDGRMHLLEPEIEWAYILNLDEKWSFETYNGLNGIRGRNAPGRYSNLSPPERGHIPGVRLLSEIPLREVFDYSDRDIEKYAERMKGIEAELISKSPHKGKCFSEIEQAWKEEFERAG